eukprot:10720020-Lingulodinium_polyedra.AAC.1
MPGREAAGLGPPPDARISAIGRKERAVAKKLAAANGRIVLQEKVVQDAKAWLDSEKAVARDFESQLQELGVQKQ